MSDSAIIPPFRREPWIDSWRGLLIFLVAVGHVAGALYHHSLGLANGFYASVYKGIYLFHMPAFFFLAGFVAERNGGAGAPGFLPFVASRARRLLIPYFVWGLVSVAVFHFGLPFFMRIVHDVDGYYRGLVHVRAWWVPIVSLLQGGGWPNGKGFVCNTVLWFLPCLFVVQLLDWGLHRFACSLSPAREIASPRRAGVGTLCLALALLALGGYLRFHPIPFSFWGIDRAPRFLGFLLLGRLFFHWKKSPSSLFPCVNFCLFSLVVVFLPNMWCARTSWLWYGVELLMAVWGCVLSCGAARRFSGAFWSALGLSSLGIMLLHKFPVLALQLVLSRIGKITNPLLAPVLLVFVTALVLLLTYPAVKFITRWCPKVFGQRKRIPNVV